MQKTKLIRDTGKNITANQVISLRNNNQTKYGLLGICFEPKNKNDPSDFYSYYPSDNAPGMDSYWDNGESESLKDTLHLYIEKQTGCLLETSLVLNWQDLGLISLCIKFRPFSFQTFDWRANEKQS